MVVNIGTMVLHPNMPDNVNMRDIPNAPVVMDNHLTTADKRFPKINFACQNVCSLNISKPSKKTHAKLAAVTRCGTEVILLNDTRLNSDKQIAGVNNIVKKLQFLGYSLHHNSNKNNRGVAILLSNKFSYIIQDSFSDEACNILLLKIVCGAISLTIGSIYGPNSDDIVFFNQLNDVIKRFNSDYVVIGGDWNTTVDGRNFGNNLDTLNTVSIPSARRSLWLGNLTTNLNLTDPYRHFFPDVREFTYVPFALDATNRSHLDFF
jgi:exonuclease III